MDDGEEEEEESESSNRAPSLEPINEESYNIVTSH